MQDIVIRAGCFVAIIILGYLLRRAGFFKEGDFHVLTKIVLKITLPAAIVSSFSGKQIESSMLVISLLGLAGGLIYMGLGYLVHMKSDRKKQAFAVVNTSGYNIGNFTLPFVQSFLGPMGVITTSLFDIGNAFICLGGAYSIATVIQGSLKENPIKKIAVSLIKSVPFDCYIIMVVLSLLHISLPAPVVSFAEIIGNGNAFLAMLMIGVGFKISANMEQLAEVVKILVIRYGVALIFALGCYFLLPMQLEVRQTLMVLAFSPIASAAPAFTADLDGDTGLSSAVNSFSIVCSIICIVLIFSVML